MMKLTPAGSNAKLSDLASEITTFDADKAGDYEVKFTVHKWYGER